MNIKKIHLHKPMPVFAVLSLLSQSAFADANDTVTVMNWSDDSGIPYIIPL